MKGAHKFCPETGVDLDEERHYDDRGIPRQAPDDDLPDDHWGNRPMGLLTNGELVSTRLALANYFRRCHQRHHDGDDDLYCAMALALRRLKTRTDSWDVWVWYALAERLSRKGYDIDWMFYHTTPRCPRCSGPLKWESTARGLQGKCAINCRNQRNPDYVNHEIRKRVRSMYNSGFPNETISDLEIVA